MRIDNSKLKPYDSTRIVQTERADASAKTGQRSNASDPAAASEPTRSDRIEQLKQMFQEGRPINVSQLAQKLLESGIFYDQKG